MNFKKSKIFLAFLISLLLVLVLLIINREPLTKILTNNNSLYRPAQPSIDQQTVGEIKSGFFLTQNMKNLNIKLNDLSPKKSTKKSEICLNLLLANYSNRNNVGKMRVTVIIEQLKKSTLVNYSEVKDNSFHSTICLNSEELAKVSNDGGIIPNGKFTIEGIKGEAGNSITAWLTSNDQYGLASINHMTTDKAVMFSITKHIQYKTIKWGDFIAILILAIVYFATISTLVFLF